VYQGTGALHILSVSGMHVGVVFIVLNFLLTFLDRFKRGKYIKSALLILLIWFYAAITGFSPAVNRAAAMITFVIVGKAFGRNTNIYNTLSASVLLLLIIDPLLIADVGFQLSYIAVLGIVTLQKKICKLWVPGNWLLTQVWMIVSVSIAAQLATFPLAMLYFHQFPNYFLLTNLIVVPLSNFIIYCGMLVLFVSPFGFLAELFAKLLVYMVYGLNESIRFIEGMPYSAIKGIQISPMETILLYLGMIFLIYYFINKRSLFLKLVFILAIIFSLSVAVKSYYSARQKNIIFYSIKKTSAMDLIDGREHVLISDSALIQSPKDIAMHIQNNWCGMHLKKPENIFKKKLNNLKFTFNKNSLFISGRFIQFYDKRFALVDEKNYRNTTDNPVPVDYLIISGNIKAEIGELLDCYKPKIIIIDSSNSLWKSEKWIKECAELNIPCYSVLISGAFEISI
ncbi:MAG: ComEC/Rec2 family competence protein, partial [Bacteroidales bacterium]